MHSAAAVHLAKIRGIIRGLAEEANLQEPEKFAQIWHMLMKGSIISAAEGNRRAAREAKDAQGRDRRHQDVLKSLSPHDDAVTAKCPPPSPLRSRRNCALPARPSVCAVKASHLAPLVAKGFFEQCQKQRT